VCSPKKRRKEERELSRKSGGTGGILVGSPQKNLIATKGGGVTFRKYRQTERRIERGLTGRKRCAETKREGRLRHAVKHTERGGFVEEGGGGGEKKRPE